MQSSSGSDDIVEHRIFSIISGKRVASTRNALSVSKQDREPIAFRGDGAQGSREEKSDFFFLTFELAVSGQGWELNTHTVNVEAGASDVQSYEMLSFHRSPFDNALK